MPLENTILLQTLTEEPIEVYGRGKDMGIEGRAYSPSKETPYAYDALTPYPSRGSPRRTANTTKGLSTTFQDRFDTVTAKVDTRGSMYNFENYTHLLLEDQLPD